MPEQSDYPETSHSSPERVRFGGDSLDFEIRFYERVLKHDPAFIEVLRVLGEQLTRKGHYRRGLQIDQQLVRLRPRDAIARYNLACSYALLHYNRLAVQALRQSIELGYSDAEHLRNDADLENLRHDPEYERLLREQGWV